MVAVVSVDASWRDGHAGLAYVGSLGDHQVAAAVRSSLEAELRALELAMRDAERAGVSCCRFRTDCRAAAEPRAGSVIGGYLDRHPGWCVQYVDRRRNRLADRLAGSVRRAARGSTLGNHQTGGDAR